MLKVIFFLSFFSIIFVFLISGFFVSFSVKDLQDHFLLSLTFWEQLKTWNICEKIRKRKGLSQLSIFICHISDILAS